MGYWSDQIFRYCERGQSGAFWAEPFNAVSNAAFIIAAQAAAYELLRRPPAERGVAELLLVVLVFVIGVGSFLFHTYATRWASYADVMPIGIFMLAYVAYALRRFLGLPWILVGLGLAGFMWGLRTAGDVQCRPGLLSVTAAANGPCLNGTVGYAPAFIAMLGVGLALLALRHRAGRYLVAAGAVFLASMTFRTIDFEVCALTRVLGKARGTHALWHIFNATTLYLLLLAAIRHGRRNPVAPVEPAAHKSSP